MVKSAVQLPASSRLGLPVAGNCISLFLDLHVAELAHFPEATFLLPEVADRFTAQSCFAVTKRTAVTLGTGGVEKEIAVISLAGHSDDLSLQMRQKSR